MSDNPPPEFSLQSVYDDGTKSEPEIVPVTRVPLETNMDRRGFLGAGGVFGTGVSAALLLSPSNAEAQLKRKAKKPAPRKLTKLLAHKGIVNRLDISPDGQFLVSGDWKGNIKLWSLPEAKLLHKTGMGKRPILGLNFDRASKTVMVVSTRSTRLWSVDSGKMLTGNLNQHKHMKTVSFSADRRYAAFATTYGDLEFYSLEPKMNLEKKIETGEAPHTLRISTDNGLLVVNKKSEFALYSLPDFNKITEIELRNVKSAKGVEISPDQKYLAVSDIVGLEYWDLPDTELINKLQVLDQKAGPLYSFSTEEKLVKKRRLRGNISSLRAYKFFKKSPFLLTGEHKRYKANFKSIKIRSVNTGKIVQELQGNKLVTRFALDQEERLLASSGFDGTIMIWERQNTYKSDFKFRTFLFDPSTMNKDQKAVQYKVKSAQTGTTTTVSYTLPCGSAIPAGAVCTCNCVSGLKASPTVTRRKYKAPTTKRRTTPSRTRRRTYTRCSCNKVCTCVPVCQAHKLMHDDNIVRHMAEQILFTMGAQEFDYMKWAASHSAPELRDQIFATMDQISKGEQPSVASWPALDAVQKYLNDPDEVVAIMAAQMSELISNARRITLKPDMARKVTALLHRSHQLNWLNRKS